MMLKPAWSRFSETESHAWLATSGVAIEDDGSRRMRYRADLTAGVLEVAESRIIADFLRREVDAEG
jgi:hypothetical protein